MLQHPCMAQIALNKFRAAEKTTSLSKICREMGAEYKKAWEGIEWTFDDDTQLFVKGRGKSHQVTVEFP